MKLAELHWPEVEKLDREKIVALVPVGSMEQHGPHLPFQVDVFCASRLAEDLDGDGAVGEFEDDPPHATISTAPASTTKRFIDKAPCYE